MDAVVRAVIDDMQAYGRPGWQAGFLLARGLRQRGLECRADIRRAARRACDTAVDVERWEWDADDLETEIDYTWDKIRYTDPDVVGTAARAARARPGTTDVPVFARIQVLVDVLWRLGQLGQRGVACPSQGALARALGCHPRMVSRYLRVAEHFGLIECVDRKYIPGQRGMTWKVLLEKYTPPKVDP